MRIPENFTRIKVKKVWEYVYMISGFERGKELMKPLNADILKTI